jgi:uncharacterized Zn finger protein
MAWGDDFRPYMRVADKLSNGKRELDAKLKKLGRAAQPVALTGRAITTTFWGKAWCDNLERYSDYESRLPKGRTYVKNGSVLDLCISAGKIEAFVAGSELYRVQIDIEGLLDDRWAAVKKAVSGRIASLVSLLAGELGPDVLSVLTRPREGLFPEPNQIRLKCSCPDHAELCKHVAAVLYGVGARLDLAPELFFTLRQVDKDELLAAASSADLTAGTRGTSTGKKIARSALSDLFAIELAPPPRSPKKR